MTIADDLPEIASIGPFFDVTTHEESSAVLTPWRLMSELITLAAPRSTSPVESIGSAPP